MSSIIFLDGKFYREEEAKVSVLDHGYLYGNGCWTTLMTLDDKLFIGGAGIVAIHAAGLGATVNFFSISGKDEYNKFANSQLKKYKVKSKIFIDESRPTTNKTRYRSNDKTLLRVSNLHQVSISKLIQNKILREIKL